MASNETAFEFSSAESDALRYDTVAISPYEVFGRIAPLIPPGARVLDVGCGAGALTALLRDRRKVDIVGVEPNPVRAARARERGLEVIEGIYSAETAAELGVFDAIVLADVIEHLAEPASLLAQVRAGLAPGGRLIVSVPNVAHWTVRLALMRGRFSYEPTGIMDATHLRWFTKQSLLDLLALAGFEIVTVQCTAGAWLPQYRGRLIGRIPESRRAAVLARLCGFAPELFACQFVVEARRR